MLQPIGSLNIPYYLSERLGRFRVAHVYYKVISAHCATWKLLCVTSPICASLSVHIYITICVCIAAIVLYHSLSVNIILLIIAGHPGAMENGFCIFLCVFMSCIYIQDNFLNPRS